MTVEAPPSFLDYSFQALSEASLSLFFMEGSGLGAVLLALVVVVFIRSSAFSRSKLSEVVAACRGASRKEEDGTDTK